MRGIMFTGKKAAALTASILIFFASLAGCGTRAVDSSKSDNVNNGNVETTVVTEESTSTYVPADMKIAAMKGPTAIGMVKLMKDSKEGNTANNYDFTIAASADEFTSLLIKGDIQAAALPCNAASTLYKAMVKLRCWE